MLKNKGGRKESLEIGWIVINSSVIPDVEVGGESDSPQTTGTRFAEIVLDNDSFSAANAAAIQAALDAAADGAGDLVRLPDARFFYDQIALDARHSELTIQGGRETCIMKKAGHARACSRILACNARFH